MLPWLARNCGSSSWCSPINSDAGIWAMQSSVWSSRSVSSSAGASCSAGAAGAPHDAPALTEQQLQELKAAVLSSFKADANAAASLVTKILDADCRSKLVAALERDTPDLSRVAMLEDPASVSEQQHNHAQPSSAPVPALIPDPTLSQLSRVAVKAGLPFVAFGFCDNALMITVGEQIDVLFGAALGLSSMMAAGLGNTVADVVGINISQSIEQKFKSMPSMAPQLNKAQLKLPQTRRAKWLGCAVGMAVGCLLGLTPLMFIEAEPSRHAAEAQHVQQQQQQQQHDQGDAVVRAGSA